MASGQFGKTLSEVMRLRGKSQISTAQAMHIDNSTLSKVAGGTRAATPDLMRSTNELLDDGQLAIAAAGEVTGGAFAPWLDNVDLHRASVLFKTVEEIKEVIVASEQAAIFKTADQISEDEREQIRLLIKETIEAITALTHLVAVLCREYTFSWLGVWKEHRADMRIKKYMK